MVLKEFFNTTSFAPINFVPSLIDISNISSNMARCKKHFKVGIQNIHIKQEGSVNDGINAMKNTMQLYLQNV